MSDDTDKLYVKIYDTSLPPNITADGNDGPLLDENGENIFIDLVEE